MHWIFVVAQMLATAQTPGDSEALQLLPSIVQSGWESAARPDGRQPLLLDIRSFRLHASMALDRDVGAAEIAGIMVRPIRQVTEEQAIQCAPQESPLTCSIVDDGILVRLDCLTRTAAGFQALVSTKWTRRRDPEHATIGANQLRIWFAQEHNVWVRKRVALVMTT